MKRVILSLTAVAMVIVVLTACTKDNGRDKIPKNKTPEEYLTINKGWRLSKGMSTPAYTNNSGYTDIDLMNVWFYECELNDILVFKVDNRSSLISTCGTGIKQNEANGTWNFISKNQLELRNPIFGYEMYDVVTVETLNDNMFKFSFTWSDGTQVYTFRITYVPVR